MTVFLVGLGRALDRVRQVPAWSMSPDQQREALLGLERAQARLAELRLRVLASADRNRVGDVDAAASTADWVAHHARVERRRAHADLRLATALDGHEVTRRALATGQVNLAQAQVILSAVDDLPADIAPEDRARGEAHLVEAAAEHDAPALRQLGRHLLEVLAPEEAERRLGEKLEAEEREARRKASVRFRPNGDGTVNATLKLPTLHAQMLEKALRALVAPARIGPQARLDEHGNPRPAHELLGRGLMELLETLPVDTLPQAGGGNATVVVMMSIEQLLGDIGVAGLDTGGEISAAEARRLAAGARLIPVVLGGDSVPIDVGRKRRFHDDYQRILLGMRDKTCTALGCDRPASWCHAHHDKAWADGGETSVANGRLLCRYHHQRIHDHTYRAHQLPDGRIHIQLRT